MSRAVLIPVLLGAGLLLVAATARAGPRYRDVTLTADELRALLDSQGAIQTDPSAKPAVDSIYGGGTLWGFDDWMESGMILNGAPGGSPGLRAAPAFDWGAWDDVYEYWTPDQGGYVDNTGYTPSPNYPHSPGVEMPQSTVSESELISLVADHLEGEEGFRDHIYDDFNGRPWTESKRGNPTIGFGHLVKADDIKRYGWGWRLQDYAQARDLLENDVRSHLRPVVPVVRRPLTVPQWVAIASLAFNAGPYGVAESNFIRHVNNGDWARAETQFKDWNKTTLVVDGVKKKVVNKGLTNRRAREWAIFMTPAETVAIAGQNYA